MACVEQMSMLVVLSWPGSDTCGGKRSGRLVNIMVFKVVILEELYTSTRVLF